MSAGIFPFSFFDDFTVATFSHQALWPLVLTEGALKLFLLQRFSNLSPSPPLEQNHYIKELLQFCFFGYLLVTLESSLSKRAITTATLALCDLRNGVKDNQKQEQEEEIINRWL